MQEDEDLHDMARFEAEARAMRATLQRMSMMGTLLAAEQQQQRNSDESGVGSSGGHRQVQCRREFLDNALLTKVRP